MRLSLLLRVNPLNVVRLGTGLDHAIINIEVRIMRGIERKVIDIRE